MDQLETRTGNRLYYGDNLSIMKRMTKYSVDLIYLDPPFKSQQNYNLIYRNMTGKPVPEQAEAFCDTWDMDAEKEHLARTMPMLLKQHGVEDYYVQFWQLWIQALRQTQPHLLAYMIYMVQRLLCMKSILKRTGSIYLHCDPTASHYIKVMMDGIFGHQNFRNEIIWKRTSAHNRLTKFGPVHDVILFYTMSDTWTWNPQHVPYEASYVETFYRHVEPGTGRRYRLSDVTSNRPGGRYEWKGKPPPGKRFWGYSEETMKEYEETGRLVYSKNEIPSYKRYLDEMPGQLLQDVWTDVNPIGAHAKARLGYPTQKPKELLRRIVTASSNPGDVVFDPFCGCGTTIYAAQEAGRKWIGCDVAILAVRLIQSQLADSYGLIEDEHYHVDGIPNSIDAARALWEHDRFQFEHWAVERVGGFPTKKTGDRGIDGRIYFETKGGLDSMVLSVKGGKLLPTDVRDLTGVRSTEPNTELAGFISLNEPSKAMRAAAAAGGMWVYQGLEYPRVQLLTVREIIEEKRGFQMPTRIGAKTATGQTMLPL